MSAQNDHNISDVHALIDWGTLPYIHANKKRRAAWFPLFMLKVMLLQSWYNLIDPKLEAQLARDLLFPRFVYLDLPDSVPDHSTLWHLRNNPNVENFK